MKWSFTVTTYENLFSAGLGHYNFFFYKWLFKCVYTNEMYLLGIKIEKTQTLENHMLDH